MKPAAGEFLNLTGMKRNDTMRTREQIRSEFALNRIFLFGETIKKDDASFIVGLPTMILSNGLGQTLAFLLSKKPKEKSDKHSLSFTIIKDWLTDNDHGVKVLRGKKLNDRNFVAEVTKLDLKDYINAQLETIKFLSWLKRYARAFQKED
jgi:CRISPR-associated protein Cmr5